MQRWVPTLVGLAVIVLPIWLVVRDFHAPKAIGHDPRSSSERLVDDGGGTLSAEQAPGASAPPAAAPSPVEAYVRDARIDGGAGTTLLDGTLVPPLPLAVPRQVRFGVVLVSYAGAQPGPSESHPATRSHADAQILAEKLLATAKEDFHAAVQQGDAGSSDDLGTVKLGVLEPAPEYILFTQAVNGVAGPVDTPRGYWIVKRLE